MGLLGDTLEAQPDSSIACWVQLSTSPSLGNTSETTENSESLPFRCAVDVFEQHTVAGAQAGAPMGSELGWGGLALMLSTPTMLLAISLDPSKGWRLTPRKWLLVAFYPDFSNQGTKKRPLPAWLAPCPTG